MRYPALFCAAAIAAAVFLAVPTAPRAQEKLPGVTLLQPEHRAVLPNNDRDGSRKVVWEFRWASVPGAQAYQLYVRGAKARIPLIDVVIGTPTARGGEVFTDGLKQLEALPRPLSHRHAVNGYIAGRNRFGWRWKVRAMVNGVWTPFTERAFDVAPLEQPPEKPRPKSKLMP